MIKDQWIDERKKEKKKTHSGILNKLSSNLEPSRQHDSPNSRRHFPTQTLLSLRLQKTKQVGIKTFELNHRVAWSVGEEGNFAS